MPIPFARRVAAFNRRVTNPILGPITWFLPTFGRIEHVGRRSGKHYSAPMMAFASDDGRRVTFALTYGPEANWVQNALAASSVDFVSRSAGRRHLVRPRLVHDPARRAMPCLIRQALGVMNVDDFLEADVADDASPEGDSRRAGSEP
jgi:deazaflavin-dependent oxidoreductase (nitroreductase family)